MANGCCIKCAFFFAEYFRRIYENPRYKYFFESRVRVGKTGAENSAILNAEAEAREKFELVGWETVIDSAVEYGWYSGLERTALESVFYSDFEDLVFRMTNKNILA